MSHPIPGHDYDEDTIYDDTCDGNDFVDESVLDNYEWYSGDDSQEYPEDWQIL